MTCSRPRVLFNDGGSTGLARWGQHESRRDYVRKRSGPISTTCSRPRVLFNVGGSTDLARWWHKIDCHLDALHHYYCFLAYLWCVPWGKEEGCLWEIDWQWVNLGWGCLVVLWEWGVLLGNHNQGNNKGQVDLTTKFTTTPLTELIENSIPYSYGKQLPLVVNRCNIVEWSGLHQNSLKVRKFNPTTGETFVVNRI